MATVQGEHWKSLTDEELAALTEEQIERYIDLACAQRGIRLLPPEPKKPELTAEPLPDVTLFKVGSWYFTDENEARALLDLLYKSTSMVDKEWTEVGKYRLSKDSPLESWNAPKLERSSAYSRSLYAEYEAIFEKNEREREAYEAKRKEYDEILRQRAEVESEILTAIQDAVARINKRERLQKEFQRYLDLAEGDRRVAMRFFRDAYPDEEIPSVGIEEAAVEQASGD